MKGVVAFALATLLVGAGAATPAEPLRRWEFTLNEHHQEFRVPLELPAVVDPDSTVLVIAVTRVDRVASRFFWLRAQAICSSGEVAWRTTLTLYPADQPMRFQRQLLQPGQSISTCAPVLLLQLAMQAVASGAGNDLPSLGGEVRIERASQLRHPHP